MPVRDFYMRQQGDPKFRPDQVEVYNEVEALINQIKMTLFTNRGEVLGEPRFGIQVEKYLFEFDIDPFGLSAIAESQVNEYVTLSRSYSIKIDPAKIPDRKSNRDVLVLNINIGEDRQFAVLYG
jgi:hypothetical protein